MFDLFEVSVDLPFGVNLANSIERVLARPKLFMAPVKILRVSRKTFHRIRYNKHIIVHPQTKDGMSLL